MCPTRLAWPALGAAPPGGLVDLEGVLAPRPGRCGQAHADEPVVAMARWLMGAV